MVVIAVSGVPGTGKSTLSDSLLDHFGAESKFPVEGKVVPIGGHGNAGFVKNAKNQTWSDMTSGFYSDPGKGDESLDKALKLEQGPQDDLAHAWWDGKDIAESLGFRGEGIERITQVGYLAKVGRDGGWVTSAMSFQIILIGFHLLHAKGQTPGLDQNKDGLNLQAMDGLVVGQKLLDRFRGMSLIIGDAILNTVGRFGDGIDEDNPTSHDMGVEQVC